MAIKELIKSVKMTSIMNEKDAEAFISKGGTLPVNSVVEEDHRLTLRIPRELMDRIDVKRKERVGKISRTLLILQAIEKYIE
jgi:hypothetical protein